MAEEREYFLPDENGEEAKGPFTFENLAEQLKSGKLRADGFVWGSHFADSEWRQFFEVEEFRKVLDSRIKAPIPKKRPKGMAQTRLNAQMNFAAKVGEYGSENLYRRFPRVPLHTEVFIHDQNIFIRGTCKDVSEKGAFIECEDIDRFPKGSEVTAVFRKEGQLATFSASCVIIRVNSNRDPKGLGLYFLRINPRVRRNIARYVHAELERYLAKKTA